MTAGTAEDPKATTTYRVMLAVVIILGVLIVLAFAALVVGGIVKVMGHRGTAATTALQAEATLPAGARITSAQVSGNRLVIVFHDARGDGVEVVDTETGKAVALITPAGPSK